MSDIKEDQLKIKVVAKKNKNGEIKKANRRKGIINSELEGGKQKINTVLRKKITLAKSRTQQDKGGGNDIQYLKTKIIKKKVYLTGLRHKEKKDEKRKKEEEEEEEERRKKEEEKNKKKDKLRKIRNNQHKLQELIEIVTARKKTRDEIKKKQYKELKEKHNIENYPTNISSIIALFHFVKPERIEQIKITNVQKFLNEHLPFIDNTIDNKAIINERRKVSHAINSLHGNSGMVRYMSGRTYYKGNREKKLVIKRGNS